MTILQYNPILAVDSYKFAHQFSYPSNVSGMFSYIEARTPHQNMVMFGLQMWIKKFLTTPITAEHIDEAEKFAALHGEPFSRKAWEHIVSKYDGYFPVTIRAIPEGLPVKSLLPLVTIECNDSEVFWLSSYLETSLLRGVWYPTTIASLDREIKKEMAYFYTLTGTPLDGLNFALHDFGGRGVCSAEQAEIGGAAHLVNFMGSDTVEGVRAANFYYGSQMSGFSVPATEHSVECSFGSDLDSERAYLKHVLDTFAKPGAIVSIVIDGYDVYRAAQELCTTFREQIIASGAKVVFRPDSGDMMETVPRILELQAATFGYEMRNGYKVVKQVGIIQGDGVDHLAIKSLLGRLAASGYAASNVIFGSGGALLQKVNRDTFKFAQKASAVRLDGKWVGIAKDPITDPGKKSKEGRVTTIRSLMTGEISAGTLDGFGSEFEDVMQIVYENGKILVETTLDEIRDRVKI